jgi:alpha-L-fucosidase
MSSHQRLARRLTTLFALIVAAMAASTTPAFAQEKPADSRLDWWREARFGMFVHWGLYAIPAGEWPGKGTNHAEWILTTAQIPVDEYEKLAAKFNPVKFNAGPWVRMAKDAGMKYIVITSKHHDGFCLFDSEYTDYDVMSTPFKRDIMRELSEACRKEGIVMCWYHSIMDWHHPDYLPRRGWEKRSAEGADFSRYVAHMKNQVKELLTNYGQIGVLWFDGEWEETWNHELGRDLYNYCRSIDPKVIINNRVDKGRNDMAGLMKPGDWCGDFGTPEQEIPPTGLPGVDWETCMTMNDHWGYNSRDKNFKTTEDLIRKLADIASKGGNFLLNVGPTAEGLIPPESVERLREIGAWMKTNGDSIHGTAASPFKALPWGRCTQRVIDAKTTRLYLHVFEWPNGGELVVPGLASEPLACHVIAEPSKGLAFSRREDAVVIQLPSGKAPDPIDTVVALDIRGRPDVADAPTITAESPIFTDSLEVSIATDRRDVELRYSLDGRDPTASSPVAHGPVRITATTTVAARAFRDGRPTGPTGRATFTKVEPKRAASIAGAQPGLWVEYVEGEFDKLPDFSVLKATKAGPAANLDLTPAARPERYALRFTGFIDISADGVYTFALESDDGSRLTIGDTVVVDNDGLHGPLEKTGVIALSKGLHPVTIGYFNKTGGRMVKLAYAGPAMPRRDVPASAWKHVPPQ